MKSPTPSHRLTGEQVVPEVVKAVASFCLGIIFLCVMLSIRSEFHPNPLTDAEIISQTEGCNREGRLSQAFNDAHGRITKVWCGLPPYQDNRHLGYPDLTEKP
jgi:hypothetical protein